MTWARRLRRISAGSWYLCQAVLALLCASAGLRLLGYGPTLKWMQATCRRRRARPAQSLASGKAAVLAQSVEVATRLAPNAMTCLRRACALSWLLGWHGYDPRICFGVRTSGGRVEAHAWVELDGIPLGEPAELHARFAPLRGSGGQ